MSITLGLMVFAGTASLVVMGGFLAYTDRFFFVRQMREKGILKGLPFIAHGAMWSDFMLLSPTLGVMTAFGAHVWTLSEWTGAFILGLVVSIVMHYLVLMKGSMPGAHGYNGRLTLSGLVHVLYAAIALAILYLFYFATEKIPTFIAFFISLAVALHFLISFGSQALLSHFSPDWFPKKPYKSPALWIGLLCLWGFIVWRWLAISG